MKEAVLKKFCNIFLYIWVMCYKVKYRNFAKAFSVMQMLNRSKGFDLKRAYECPNCGKWHLTSLDLAEYLHHK